MATTAACREIVARDTPRALAIWVALSPRARRAVAAARLSGSMTVGRPPTRPWARAAASPAMVRWWIMSRSSSANAATELVRGLNQRGKSFAEPVDTSGWAPTPGAYQSTEYCSYRLGGDATEGASALLSVRLPSFGQTGASVVVYFDVGLAISGKMRLDEAARILSAGLIAATSVVPLALADLLPMEAEARLAELHIGATDPPNAVYNASAGTSPLTDRLDLPSLGTRERPASRTLGFSAQIPGPLADQQATELTVEAINY